MSIHYFMAVAVLILLLSALAVAGEKSTRESVNQSMSSKGENTTVWLSNHSAPLAEESKSAKSEVIKEVERRAPQPRYESGTVYAQGANAESAENASKSNRLLVDATYKDVFSILREKNSCSDFYGGRKDSLDVFDRFANLIQTEAFEDEKIGIRMKDYYLNGLNAATGSTYRLFKNVKLNTRGAFFNAHAGPNKHLVVGSFSGKTRQARALILLHELGHLMKGADGKWLLPDDGKDLSLSERNTSLVEEKCGDALKELQNKETIEKTSAALASSGTKNVETPKRQ